MPLIAKVPFVSGAVFTPEIATEMTGVTFDDQPSYYGHFAKVADADLSDAAGAIKDRVAKNELNLKVTAGTGLNANFTAGQAIYGTTIFTIGASSIALTASSANYVYVDIGGVIRASTAAPPTVRALLAIVSTNTTGVITVIDEREGYKIEVIKPLATTLQNFGGKGGQGAKVMTASETLPSGEYYYTDFTVPLGVTCFVDKLAYIYCSGSVSILGTINVNPASTGGLVASVNINGAYLSPGQGLGAGISERLANGSYHYKASPVGSGGSSGSLTGASLSGQNEYNITNAGGSGGGGLIIEAANNITVGASAVINADGIDGQSWVNISIGGSQKAKCGGSGGGSGGHIQLKALQNLIVAGTLRCVGGKGGDGSLTVSNGDDVLAESGSGGGGGWIVLFSNNVNTTGSTLLVTGGAIATQPGSLSPVCRHVGYGGVGGSYAGKAGDGNAGNGTAGNIGTIRIGNGFVPF